MFKLDCPMVRPYSGLEHPHRADCRSDSARCWQTFPLKRSCWFGVFQLQSRSHREVEQLRQELESAQKKSLQQLQSRVVELESSCSELTEKKYKNESVIRDLKVKLVGSEEVG